MPTLARVVAIILAFVCSQTLLSQGSPKKPAGGKPTKPGAATIHGELGKKLDEIVNDYGKSDGGLVGSVLVARGKEILLEKGYGFFHAAESTAMPVDALWDWASVSKQFTAAAVLRLQDQKKLKLDDPLSKHFQNAPAEKAKITIRQLLEHTSGIESGFKSEWSFDARDRKSLEDCVLSRPMTSKPGERFDYSNSGYALAAALVERISGKAFEDFCEEELFKPAAMIDAGFIGQASLPKERVPLVDRGQGFKDRPGEFRFAYGNSLTWGYRGCGGVVASVRDLFHWDLALRGDKVLSAKAKQEFYRVGRGDYALGWTVNKDAHGLRVEHSGGVQGVVTNYLRHLETGVIVAIALSYKPSEHPKVLSDRLAEAARTDR